MPIKFRCPHCQQFLGISRSRAGAVTDCPMCGRSIRVPQLDGSVEPMPQLELNLQDQGLASALDKLAGLVEGTPAAGQESADLVATAQRASISVETPKPIPLPEPIELPPAPTPRVIEPEPVRAPHSLPLAEHPSPASHDAVLASIGQTATDPRAAIRAGVESSPRGPLNLRVLLAIAIPLALGVGFALGRWTAAPQMPRESVVSLPVDPAVPAPPPVIEVQEPALTGRISYVAADGATRPDAGARILVLPEQRQGTAKLPPEAFRPGANDEDQRLARAAIRALGGDFTVADAEGRYETQLPQAGLYQVILLSRYQPRAEGAPIEASVQQFLSAYFDRPAQIVGTAATHLSPFRYRGSGTSPRDQTFERP